MQLIGFMGGCSLCGFFGLMQLIRFYGAYRVSRGAGCGLRLGLRGLGLLGFEGL